MRHLALAALALTLAACAQDEPVEDPNLEVLGALPESLAPMGDGYPQAGSPCRRLGESDATREYLDDSAVLVGCPSRDAAEALGGQVVADIGGVRLVSIPTERAATASDRASGEGAGMTGSQRDYTATAIVSCGFDNAAPVRDCDAGVVRDWQDEGKHLVEITRPDGGKRAIFYDGTTPTGADGSEADGSAGWTFRTERNVDEVTVRYGPETYILFDALITGG